MNRINFDKLAWKFMILGMFLILISLAGLIYLAINYIHWIYISGHIALLLTLLSMLFSGICMILSTIIPKT